MRYLLTRIICTLRRHPLPDDEKLAEEDEIEGSWTLMVFCPCARRYRMVADHK